MAKGTTVLYNNEGQKIAQQKSHLKRGWGGGGGQEFENFGIFFSLPEKNSNLGSAVGSLGIQKSHTRSQIILDRRMRKSNDNQ